MKYIRQYTNHAQHSDNMDGGVQFTQPWVVSQDMRTWFDKNGFLIVRNIFSQEEITKLLHFFEGSEEMEQYSYRQDDGEGKKTKICLWTEEGDDIGDMAVRSDKIVTTFEKLLGVDELYHYHTKLMMKEARTGGAHVWHQDYGYWYENLCMFPDMGSVFIPLDKATRENGCLQVLAGSHRMGRLDTALIGTGDIPQRGANPSRVELAKQCCALVFAELDPGDVIFFHSNLLHKSSQNLSDNRRWSLISAYNNKANNPLRKHHFAQYHPLNKVQDSAIIKCSNKKSTIVKQYFNPQDDKSIER